MSFWHQITLIILLTFAAAAIGVHVALVGCASVLASCISIVVSMGGLGDIGPGDEQTAMVLGFGTMLLVPILGATVLAVALGRVARLFLASHGIYPLDVLDGFRPAPIADSREAAAAVALRQFRRGSAIKIKCPSCHALLVARRVLSAGNQVPDVEVSCPCGVCTGVHPFVPAEA